MTADYAAFVGPAVRDEGPWMHEDRGCVGLQNPEAPALRQGTPGRYLLISFTGVAESVKGHPSFVICNRRPLAQYIEQHSRLTDRMHDNSYIPDAEHADNVPEIINVATWRE